MSEPRRPRDDQPTRPDQPAPYEPRPYEPHGVYGPATHVPAQGPGDTRDVRAYGPVRPEQYDAPTPVIAKVGRVMSLVGILGFMGIIAFNLLAPSLPFLGNDAGLGGFGRMATTMPIAVLCWLIGFIGIALSSAGGRRRH